MRGYLAVLLMKRIPDQPEPNIMSRKLFFDKTACLIWIGERDIPPFAFGWWIEEFDDEGNISCSYSVKSEHRDAV